MINPEDIARTIAYSLDGEYSEGLDADMSAHAGSNPTEAWVTTIEDDGAKTEFLVTVTRQAP